MKGDAVNAALGSETSKRSFPRFLRATAHDLDLIGGDGGLTFELESYIPDKERPNFVAKPIGIQVTLWGEECKPPWVTCPGPDLCLGLP